MKYPIFAAVALVAVTGTAWLVAQDEDHALRLWLIDRIEDAYANGDSETLRRMAEREYEYDVGEWLSLQSAGPTRITQAMAGGPPGATCPPGTVYVEKDGLCHQPPSTGPTGPPVPPIPDFEPDPIPKQPPPPPLVVQPPLPSPWGNSPPPVPDLCALAWQTVASCLIQERAICTAADKKPEEPALARLCADQRRECARLTVLAIRLCNDPNRP